MVFIGCSKADNTEAMKKIDVGMVSSALVITCLNTVSDSFYSLIDNLFITSRGF